MLYNCLGLVWWPMSATLQIYSSAIFLKNYNILIIFTFYHIVLIVFCILKFAKQYENDTK